jgi:23S rRNA (guanosine2251-2'-O)-methyltransferase
MKKDRYSSKKVWLYGQHVVRAVLDNPKRHPFQVWLTPETQKTLGLYNQNTPCPIVLKKAEHFAEKFGPQAVHQGCAIEATPLEETFIEDTVPPQDACALYIILDQVTDPHNIGAILRSAAAFGASAVIIPDRNAAPSDSPILAKSACGATEACPLIRVPNLGRALDFLKEHQVWCYGLDERGESIQKVFPKLKSEFSFLSWVTDELPPRVAFVLGAEGRGLRRLTREKCDFLISLPTQPHFPTLNVSAAAATALYTFALRFPPKKQED